MQSLFCIMSVSKGDNEMNNVIKAVFIAMLENVGADYNDDMLNRLVAAYLKANKDIGEVKFIRQEVLDKAMQDHEDFEDYYDLDCIEVISNEEYNEFVKMINVFVPYNDPLDGDLIEFLILKRFFASELYSVIKSI